MKPSKQFSKTVREALKHFHDPQWLGQNSPLATLYFLGRHATDPTNQAPRKIDCGHVLSQLLWTAAQRLWPGEMPSKRQELLNIVTAQRMMVGNKGGHYHFLLLELRYFRKYFSKFDWPFDARGMQEFLDVTNGPFFTQLNQATDALIVELLQLARPTYRLEQPRLHRPIIGRNNLVQTIQKQLHSNQAVALTGMGGVGKTTAGIAVYTQWSQTPKFWYTFRPPLHDQFNGLIFSLAHFLHQHGHSTLWLQLMVDGGQLKNPSHLQGYLASDLKLQPLLCFDEVDRLIVSSQSWSNDEHANIVELLEMLAELTPILLIGQRTVIDTPRHYTVPRFALLETTKLLTQTGQAPEQTMIAEWHQFAHGNPRLLLLFAMLHANGEVISAESVNLAGPFRRLWRRLSAAERKSLALLSVFRSPAPADAWYDQDTLNILIERQLVTQDDYSGVQLLSIYRSYLYQNVLLQEMREHQHEQAAIIRGQRGEYTSAAYHYAEANEPAKALAIWYPNQKIEVSRGFGVSAHAIFANLSGKQLSKREKKQLKVVQSTLAYLVGDLNAILDSAELRTDNTLEDVNLDEHEGRAHHLQRQSDQALASYDNALSRLAYLTSESARFSFRCGQVFLEERRLQEANHAAQHIFYYYKRLQANIARQRGDFQQAEEAFLEALAVAETLEPLQQASLHQQLMFLYGQKGQLNDIEYHAGQALKIFKALGYQFLEWLTQTHLAAAYMQVGRYQDAINLGKTALSFFSSINHSGTPLPELFNTLAESYFELDDLENALMYAQRVWRSEESEVMPYGAYTLARIHIKRQKYKLAHDVFHEALQIAEANEDVFIEAYLLRARSGLYKLQGNVACADTNNAKANALFRKMNLI